jgi:hypothetical protein
LALVLATAAVTGCNKPAGDPQPPPNTGGPKDGADPKQAPKADHLKAIDPGVTVSAEDAEKIWAVLDKYIANFRMPVPDYIDKHLETLHFPHVRIASHKVFVFPDAKSYKDLSTSPKDLESTMQSGWDHSFWKTRRIVQADPEKVHVATSFDRFTKDDKLIATEHSLYILEKIDGRWGVRGRSSFAK